MNNLMIRAIQALLLGARVQDAAMTVDVNPAKMRNIFLWYCRKKQPTLYEELCMEAANKGYSSPPVSYFQPYALVFFSLEDYQANFIKGRSYEYLDWMLLKSMVATKKKLSRTRLDHSALKGLKQLRSID